MRLRTIQRKVKKTGLPKKYIEELFLRMKGIPDESISLSGKYNEFWIMTVREILNKYCRDSYEQAKRNIG